MPDIRRPLRKLIPVLLKAQENNLNEADTVQRLAMVFEQVFGYDRLEEITRELQVKDKYVDIAIKIDGVTKLLVEAKSAGTDLRERHIEQAKSYAAEGNIRWAVLTNGVIWNLYHLTFDEGIEYERVFSVDLSVELTDRSIEHLELLHRTSVRRGDHEEYWKRYAALDAASLGQAIYTDSVLRLIRREVRKREGISIDPEDLADAIHIMLSPESREKIGPVKIRRQRARTKAPVASVAVPAAGVAPAVAVAAAGGGAK